MNLAALLAKAARHHGDRPAIALGDRPIVAYAELADRAARLAGGFRNRLALAPGDRVAIAMTNCPAYLEVMAAIWHAGLAAVPINAKLHPKEFAYILENSGARACFVTADLEGAIGEAAGGLPDLRAIIRAGGTDCARLLEGPALPPAETEPDDLAWLFYTSGTTGRPKGAMLTHRNLLAMGLYYLADVDAVAATDCIIHAAPLSHGSGLYAVPHLARAACHVVPESGGFDPDEMLALIRVHRGATVFAAPTMVGRLIHSPAMANADTRHLKTLVYGGGPMYVEDCLKALAALGPKLIQIYGQGESPMTITMLSRERHADTAHPRYRDRLASVGRPFTGLEVRTADPEGNEVPAGEIGEILVRGDTVMAGYWQNPEASAASLRAGWLHTGDLGAFDADGFLALKDRSKDLIISGGANIYPREVEEVLLKHPGVLEASVVGRPHADWGEEVVAFVVARPGQRPSDSELDALCLANIARFKRPRAYRHIDALPKNNYGKVLKTELRKLLG
jgi:long-chain acyl-CoA synthetase